MGMGKYQAENQNGMKGMPSFLPPPFLLPGSLEPENQERLVDGLIRHRLNPFTACGDYYSNHNTMVLVLEDVVELVEQKQPGCEEEPAGTGKTQPNSDRSFGNKKLCIRSICH